MSLANGQYVDENGTVYNDAVAYRQGVAPQIGTSSGQVVATSTTRVRASGLVVAGVITILLALWGGIIPFIGPTFSYSADGSTAWNMTNGHLVVAVLPGAVAFAAGLVMLMTAPRAVAGSGRGALSLAGVLAFLAGAWLVVGPLAWPVVSSAGGYFVPAAPLRELGFQIGYAFGPGVLIAAAGGFALGWSARHQVAKAWTRSRLANDVVGMPATRTQTVPAATGTGTPVYRQPVVTNQPLVTNQPVVAANEPVAYGQPVVTDQTVVSD